MATEGALVGLGGEGRPEAVQQHADLQVVDDERGREDLEAVDAASCGFFQVMGDERSERPVSVERHAVEVGGFTLVPAGGRRQIDDRGDRAVLHRRRLDEERPVGPAECDTDGRAAVRRMQAGERAAGGELGRPDCAR